MWTKLTQEFRKAYEMWFPPSVAKDLGDTNELGKCAALRKFRLVPVGKQSLMTAASKGKKAKILSTRFVNLDMLPVLCAMRKVFISLVYSEHQQEALNADMEEYIKHFLRAKPTTDESDFLNFKWYVVCYEDDGTLYPVGYFKVLQDYERQWTKDYKYMPAGTVPAYLSEVYVDRDMANLFKKHGMGGLGRLIVHLANMALCRPKTGSCQLLVVDHGTKASDHLQLIYQQHGYKKGDTIVVSGGPNEVRMHAKPEDVLKASSDMEKGIPNFNCQYEFPPEELMEELKACNLFKTTSDKTLALPLHWVCVVPNKASCKRFLCKIIDGTPVRKTFDDVDFDGVVIEYDPVLDCYLIEYSDGDKEHLSRDQLFSVCVF